MVFTDSEEDDLDQPRIKLETHNPSKIVSTRTDTRTADNPGIISATATEAEDTEASIRVLSTSSNSKKRRSSPPTAVSHRVELDTGDELNYAWEEDERAKQKAAEAKKRALRSARKIRAIAREHDAPSKARTGGTSTGVGRQAPRKRRKVREYGESDPDEDLMEWTTPDYVQARRKKFDERTQKLKAGGLQLPPSYDEVFFSDDEHLQDLEERPNFPDESAVREKKDIQLPYSLGLIPASIARFLRDYQVKGVAFLHELFVYQKGGILGDDMGLGKTVQVVAFLTAAYGKTGDERDSKRMRKMRRANREYPRTLIICPGTLMNNWRDELERWGWWHVDIYHGNASNRHEVFLTAQAGMLEVMITTYHTYRANRSEINMVKWDCVVADECHQIKDRNSGITKAMNEVNALCRIGLTGTAIQNKYEELWTLLNWTNRGRFGPVSTWKTTICEPLKLGQSHDASNYQLARARKTAKMLVNNLLPQFFLRRTKSLIKDQLPKKTDRVVFCPLTPTQAEAYQNFLESDVVQYIKTSSQLCECGSGKKAGWCCHMELPDGTRWQNWVLPAMHVLRHISNHLAVLIPQGADPSDKQAKDLELLQIALPDQWQTIYRTRDSILHTGNPEFCGKWRVLQRLLSFWHDQGDNKVLIFSHSVRLLKMLRDLFISTKFNVNYLDGSMHYEDRYAAVRDFNTDPTQFVFLISTRAGGVGLNITSANKVVVVDPHWNPAYDLQAQDRAYRIGQTRDVEVFRLISQGTLEEIVYARQIYKQQQANIGYTATSERRYFQGVQDRKDQKGEIFGIQNLFAFQGENQVLRDIVNKTNIAESKAGVRVADLDLGEHDFDPEDTTGAATVKAEDTTTPRSLIKTEDDEAMSQLAAEIIGEAPRPRAPKTTSFAPPGKPQVVRKSDPVQAILSSVGVSYTHENSEVIGSSKVEALLSKRAEEAASTKAHWGTQEQQSKVFEDESQSVEVRGGYVYLNNGGRGQNGASASDSFGSGSSGIRYKYRPPQDVMKRQLCSMACWAGYGEDVVSFALVVENWTQAERRECLDRFYHYRRDVLDGLVESEDVKAEAKIKSEQGERVKQETKVKEEEGSSVHGIKFEPKEESDRAEDVSAETPADPVKKEKADTDNLFAKPAPAAATVVKNEYPTRDVVDLDVVDVATASEDEDDEL
ncbi:DNA excision repair protein ERCC-6-like 2 [Exophiala dermatitidis]